MNKALRKAVIAGNWKMNNTPAETTALLEEMKPLVADADCDVIICAPFVDLQAALDATKGSNIQVGAENCHWAEKGAFTAEVSAPMLKAMGVPYVIIGHSERRQYFGETNETVNKRVRAALDNGLKVILCVGEVLEEREQGVTFEVVGMQTKIALQGVSEEESVVVCPVDPYAENDYFETLKALSDRAAASSANLVLMGIEPTYPSEKYGYIIPIGKEQVSKVSMFKEKPTQEVAKDYIAKGALWNGGVFAFKLGYVLKRAHELIDFVDYKDLFNKYDTLNKISFDYAVVEHEPEIEVMRFAGTWKDLGTWNTLTEAMDSQAVGEAMFNEKCENVHVVNELDVPILCMGLKDVVISASPEGILVSDKEQSSYIKPFVNTLDHRVMFAEKSWGSFKVIDIDKASMTIKVTLNAGHQMNYHSHQYRDEVWTVIAGEGKTVVDGRRCDHHGRRLSPYCYCQNKTEADRSTAG